MKRLWLFYFNTTINRLKLFLFFEMKHIITLILFLFISSALHAQVHKQFNIIVNKNDSVVNISYELKFLDNELKELNSLITADQDSFIVWLLTDLKDLPQSRRQLLLYFHGMWGSQSFNFNRSYKLMYKWYVQREISDIAHIVSVKWPGNEMDYRTNKKAINIIKNDLQSEMLLLVQKMQLYQLLINDLGSSFDLLAHSLGNELVKELFKEFSFSELSYPLFDQIILAASDLDVNTYEQDLFNNGLSDLANRTHIYYSKRDLTLEVSKNLNRKDRLGRVGPEPDIQVPENVIFIDTENVKDDKPIPELLTGHSYYRSSKIVSMDILESLLGYQDGQFSYRLDKHPEINNFQLYAYAKDY